MNCEVCASPIAPTRIENALSRNAITRVCGVRCKHIANRARNALDYPAFFAVLMQEALERNIIAKPSPTLSAHGTRGSAKSVKKTSRAASPARTKRKK